MNADKDTACIPRTGRHSRSCLTAQPSCRASLHLAVQDLHHGFLECRKAMLYFVLVQAIEYVPAQGKPDNIWIIGVHQLTPYLDGHAIRRFFVPGEMSRPEQTVFAGIKDRAVEVEGDGHLAAFNAGEILCRSSVEIERARHLQINNDALFERRGDDARICPQHAPESLAPLRRGAKEVGQPPLFIGAVAAA